MSLLADLLELDGEILVEGDAATMRLDKALAEARSLTPTARAQAAAKIVALTQDTREQLVTCCASQTDLLERAANWELAAQRTADPGLSEQATERAEQSFRDAAGVTEEIAEYEATLQRLDEISTLLDRAGRE